MSEFDCVGLVLAGGRSSRMGSDKANLMRGNLSLLAFSQQLLLSAGVSEVLVSRNTGCGVADIVTEKGPLGGIYSVLKYSESIKNLMILAVDMPLLAVEDIRHLMDVGHRTEQAVCFEDNFFPLYLPVSPQLVSYLEQQLFEDGNLKVKAMIDFVGGRYQPHIESRRLMNTNTLEQWQKCQALI